MNYDKLCSGTESVKYNLYTGYCDTTVLFFKDKGIYLKIKAKGDLDFYSGDDTLLAKVSLPKYSGGGRELYTEVICKASCSEIHLVFPIYTWRDTYPNCDGENDRWVEDKRIRRVDIRFKLDTMLPTTPETLYGEQGLRDD